MRRLERICLTAAILWAAGYLVLSIFHDPGAARDVLPKQMIAQAAHQTLDPVGIAKGLLM